MEKMPVFIKIEEYEDVINTMATLKKKINDAKNTLDKIHQLKQEEDSQLQSWSTALSEIESRLAAIDQFLHEPEQF
jgi:DNA repair exonuclease SbcCD ATPase subunit